MQNLERPVIFIGSGRSGTTIISEIIFRHESLAWPSNYQERFPSVAAVNLIRNAFDNRLWHFHGQKPQLNKVSKINKILFRPAEAYSFWEYITGPRIDFSRGFLLNETAAPAEKEKILKAFNKIVAYQFRDKLAFKITGPARIGYLKSIFSDAVFVNIIREPLPTINSWLNVDFWQTKGKHRLWWKGAYTKLEEEWAQHNADKPELLAAMQYKKLMDTTNDEIQKHKADCLTILYEDFVKEPMQVVTNILEYTGLGKSKEVDKYMQKNKVFNRNTQGNHEMNGYKKYSFDKPELHEVLSGQLAL
ncbi:MAG TPA: sulfotransferase [Panacibacter sp.]|nr:sulfotransferase [Panacibacter sp.]